MHNPDNYLAQVVKTLPSANNCFMILCRDSTVSIITTLFADCKDPTQNRDRIPSSWVQLHIAHVISILLL